jgi:hypothetical protein
MCCVLAAFLQIIRTASMGTGMDDPAAAAAGAGAGAPGGMDPAAAGGEGM